MPGALGCGTTGLVTYDDIVNRDLATAAAAKTAWPSAQVFGPVVAQEGIFSADETTVQSTLFADYYLQKLAAAPMVGGKPVVDAFDVHYFNNGTGGLVDTDGTYHANTTPIPKLTKNSRREYQSGTRTRVAHRGQRDPSLNVEPDTTTGPPHLGHCASLIRFAPPSQASHANRHTSQGPSARPHGTSCSMTPLVLCSESIIVAERRALRKLNRRDPIHD